MSVLGTICLVVIFQISYSFVPEALDEKVTTILNHSRLRALFGYG